MLTCFYALGGINYKNGVITTCPRQANQLVFANETILPSQIFNHKNFLAIRKSLFDNRWPSGCDTCEEMEKVGSTNSMRHDFVLDDDNTFCHHVKGHNRERTLPKLLDCYDTKTQRVTNQGLRHVEFRFSTACNMACLHCSKVYSSGWTKKLRHYEPDEEVVQNDLRQLLGTEHRHGPNDKNEMSLTTKESMMIVEDLNENFPNLEYVDFAGGELLYQKQFFPTLEKLALHPNAKNIKISFHTNFNADFSIEKLCEVLKPFHSSAMLISVDAGRSFYSYFRHGGTWDKLKSNIKEFKKLNDYTVVDVSCTTSIYQMLDIYDVFDSFLELECNFDASLVQTPKYLDPTLPFLDYKNETLKDLERTRTMLEKSKSRYVNKHRGAMFWFDYIVDYVTKFKPKYREFNRFLVYRKKSDEIWGQNFNDYFQNYKIEDDELVRVA